MARDATRQYGPADPCPKGEVLANRTRRCNSSPGVQPGCGLRLDCASPLPHAGGDLVLTRPNPALRASELRYVLRQSKSAGLIHAGEYRGSDMGAIAREVEGEVHHRFCLEHWQTTVHSQRRRVSLPGGKPDAPAQIQYTSGTTGEPKGAMLRHRSLVTNTYYVASRAGMDQGVFVSPMPLFHPAGSGMSVLGSVTTRSTFVLPLVFDPEMVLAAMERESVFKVSSRARCTSCTAPAKTASAALPTPAAKILAIPRGIPAVFVASAHRLQPLFFEHNEPRAETLNTL